MDRSRASAAQYVVGLRARNCTTGDILADEQAQAARKEDVLGALSQIASRFRTRVGESLATIEKYSTPLEEATTSSLEALKAYSTAVKVRASSGAAAARPLFERAVAIDPNFAIAHARLGLFYSTLGESALSRQSTLKAHQLRDRASDVERFFIDTLYDRDVTGNLEREQRTLESWAQTYPRDAIPHGLLSGFATRSTGKYELSLDEANKAIALDPDLAAHYSSKAFSELFLNRLADAEATVSRAIERRLEDHFFPGSVLHRLFEGRWRGHQTEGSAGQGKALHGRHDFTPGGARPGSRRPIAGSETDVCGRRRRRQEGWSARTGGVVRGGNRGVGRVLRECGRGQTADSHGPRARQRPRRGLCRRVRAGHVG